MFNTDAMIAIIIAISFSITVFFMNKNKIKLDYITELKLALLLAKMSFKDVKLQKIADILMSIVVGLENTHMTSKEKKAEAMKKAVKEIQEKVNVSLDEDILSMIIDIAVSYMKENK
ncbi:hypothetical protein HMPREF9630_00540 [Peptoanaerobacter stomatis]|uniref:Phage holin, LL-H family n=1 Tax=Peptoanaerobacter stomatis TaxID=796937 RepID=V9HUJ7_9FIRM|nr:hypothetical protein [Peptoanaerobacter stomatis]EHL17373.1 hypothetical protein HMPREF9630_00540 [Peptoanaerobacter stomatis]